MQIKLRRQFEGQDSWGAFLEEVGVDPSTGTLAYRRSEGGNCCYGPWQPWAGEDVAIEFLAGPMARNSSLRQALVAAVGALFDLSEYDESKTWQDVERDSSINVINFGRY